MSWNEPGGDKKDPWSGRKSSNQPPDLDAVVRSFQEKLGGIFGKSGGGGGKPTASAKGVGLIVLVAVILWGLTGFYTVNEGFFGVITRFGAYTETTPSGLHWRLPFPIEEVTKVDVQRQRIMEVGYRSGGNQSLGTVPREALMLTEDENIVDIRLAVQYQVKDAKQFLFNVFDPKMTLKEVTESALRAVIGTNTMDYVLKEGRSEIVANVKNRIQTIMDNYESGISIASVNLQDAQPPEEVQAAFEDAIKAREDKQRVINEAEAYSNDVVPKARGAAARLIQEAEAYKQRVIAQSEGEAARFNKLLVEYKRAPDVTRRRLYIEAMENVLSNVATVMIDVKGGNNLLYIPIDKLGNRGSTAAAGGGSKSVYTAPPQNPVTKPQSLRSSNRGREGRGR